MNKNELERIVLDALDRLDAEAKERSRTQDERIREIKRRVTGFERDLTRSNELSRSLQLLVRDLDSTLLRIKNG